MPKKTRPRIDKKKGITFKLVSRSQKDPLIIDETAPQHVLIPANIRRNKEQAEYGIYYDDNYDYLKHLKSLEEFNKPEWDLVPEIQKKMVKKSSDNKPKIMFPSSVFPSLVQEKEGMLSKGVLPVGPQPDWDPDIVAALDDDFDYDDPNNKLDDDFVVQAMASSSDDEDNGRINQNLKKYHNDSDDDYFYKDETKSVFTNYTLTSSILPRNEGLTYIDQHFETLYEKEYAEDNVCAFDSDDDGIDPNECELLQNLVKENEKTKVQVSNEYDDTVKLIEILENCSDDDLEVIQLDKDNRKDKENKWDCESIISTYSNLYNHPKLICEEKSRKCSIDRKTGLPMEFIDKGALTKKRLKHLDKLYEGKTSERSVTACSRISELSFRPDNETPEERKQRKSALKEYRRERRLEKKANKLAFKLESEKQKKEMLNIKNSFTSMKLI